MVGMCCSVFPDSPCPSWGLCYWLALGSSSAPLLSLVALPALLFGQASAAIAGLLPVPVSVALYQLFACELTSLGSTLAVLRLFLSSHLPLCFAVCRMRWAVIFQDRHLGLLLSWAVLVP